MRAIAALDDFTNCRIPGESAAIGRILVGVACFLQALYSGAVLGNVLEPSALRVPFISWMPVLPHSWLLLFVVTWLVSALCFTLGARTTLSGIALVLLMGYSIVVDQQSYRNHVYLMVIVVGLLTLGKAGSCISFDSKFGRGALGIPKWPIELIKIQLSILYFFAAVAKINFSYLSGVTIRPNVLAGWLMPLPDALDRHEVFLLVALFSIALEFYLAFALWLPRHRKVAMSAGAVLHISFVLAFPAGLILALTIFALTIFAMYAQFIEPATWRRIVQRQVVRFARPARQGRPVGQADTPR